MLSSHLKSFAPRLAEDSRHGNGRRLVHLTFTDVATNANRRLAGTGKRS